MSVKMFGPKICLGIHVLQIKSVTKLLQLKKVKGFRKNKERNGGGYNMLNNSYLHTFDIICNDEDAIEHRF